jgi:hypothetical protein
VGRRAFVRLKHFYTDTWVHCTSIPIDRDKEKAIMLKVRSRDLHARALCPPVPLLHRADSLCTSLVSQTAPLSQTYSCTHTCCLSYLRTHSLAHSLPHAHSLPSAATRWALRRCGRTARRLKLCLSMRTKCATLTLQMTRPSFCARSQND